MRLLISIKQNGIYASRFPQRLKTFAKKEGGVGLFEKKP
jgi:hypothetical protein